MQKYYFYPILARNTTDILQNDSRIYKSSILQVTGMVICSFTGKAKKVLTVFHTGHCEHFFLFQ